MAAGDIPESAHKLIKEALFVVPVFALQELLEHSKIHPFAMFKIQDNTELRKRGKKGDQFKCLSQPGSFSSHSGAPEYERVTLLDVSLIAILLALARRQAGQAISGDTGHKRSTIGRSDGIKPAVDCCGPVGMGTDQRLLPPIGGPLQLQEAIAYSQAYRTPNQGGGHDHTQHSAIAWTRL